MCARAFFIVLFLFNFFDCCCYRFPCKVLLSRCYCCCCCCRFCCCCFDAVIVLFLLYFHIRFNHGEQNASIQMIYVLCARCETIMSVREKSAAVNKCASQSQVQVHYNDKPCCCLLFAGHTSIFTGS